MENCRQFHHVYALEAEVLARGGYAEVRRAKHKNSNQMYAVKMIDVSRYTPNQLKRVIREIEILGKINHPRCIQLRDHFVTKEHVFIVTDLLAGGDLLDKLLEVKRYNEEDAAYCVQQILEGVAYLHKRNIVHRDIKLENIFLKDSSTVSHVVIGDFGLSAICGPSRYFTTVCGSPGYVAPEILRIEETTVGTYNFKVDLWGIGIILYTLLSGSTPFDRAKENRRIMTGAYDMKGQVWDAISSGAKDMVRRLLCVDPRYRPSAEDALRHSWISKHSILRVVADRQQAKDNKASTNSDNTRSQVQEQGCSSGCTTWFKGKDTSSSMRVTAVPNGRKGSMKSAMAQLKVWK